MKLISIVLLVFALSLYACSQTMPMGFRWDKNMESDMHHYDLFTLALFDSTEFYTLVQWSADTTKYVKLDSTIHMPNLLATIPHIFSPIDSMTFEWDQTMSNKYLRGYILAADSARNVSFIVPSINIVYIGDRDSPDEPRFFRFKKR